MKNFHIVAAALSAIALALAAGSAHAQVVNGGFDGLTGWTTGGDAASVGGDHLVLTTSETTQQDDADASLPAGARNVSSTDPLYAGGGIGSLEEFVGVAPGAFDPDPANIVYAFEGSAASQTFAAAAGSRLSFQWDLSTLDQRDPARADYAFVVIDGQVIRLADAFAATAPTADGAYTAHTGWTDYAATFATGGTHTISFGVVDVGDFVDTSALSVTGVNVSAVPESSTLALMGAGLAMLALRRRRRNA
jgi:hypothetical protein